MEKIDNRFLGNQKVESKENPKELAEIFYLFRHDPPIYGVEADKEMHKQGFSGKKNYTGAKFAESFESPDILQKDLPKKKKLRNLSRSGKSKIFPNSHCYNEDNDDYETYEELKSRAVYEGGIDEIKDRKNLNFLTTLIKDKQFKPVFLVGPRTRHLFTYNSVVNHLKEQGVEIKEPILSHTDKLTDINSHWLPLMEIAKDLEMEDPWSTVKDSNFHKEMKDKGIETMVEIRERIRKYLAVLEKWWARKNNPGKTNIKEDRPIFIGFTSDFEQRALLQLMGIKEVNGIDASYFKSAPGSYICVEVAKDNTAKIFYQSPNNDNREFFGEINNFKDIIFELKNKKGLNI